MTANDVRGTPRDPARYIAPEPEPDEAESLVPTDTADKASSSANAAGTGA